MKDVIRFIVGLGNPGPQYDQTRHNAGFDYVDALARQHNGSWKTDTKYQAETCSITLSGEKIWLMKPMTFMNRSGQSVASFANFFKIPAENILVAHDELDIAPGSARFKKGGGHGGHNGLRDIIACLGNNKEFYRLRLGIGHPGNARDVANYVLSKGPVEDRVCLERAIDCALNNTSQAIDGQWSKAMNNLHSFKAE
ncbi:aminoacyl-tRNA hydrolase [Reinekea sp. G2M2-21]|uniref:aminoacyl-tRNA hydrolase n=1 Tax=Reinekea sp. G2M2-21 TaxID=2788942 RepID=UPI0018A8F00F|nr:aminoacyl-tRNA hydrolase [Reinekea sp. G2M2-21]